MISTQVLHQIAVCMKNYSRGHAERIQYIFNHTIKAKHSSKPTD